MLVGVDMEALVVNGFGLASVTDETLEDATETASSL